MNTFYVDSVSGDDAHDGLTPASALKSLVAAAAKSDVGTIEVKGYGSVAED